MRRFILISILILALGGQAFAMGLHGDHQDGWRGPGAHDGGKSGHDSQSGSTVVAGGSGGTQAPGNTAAPGPITTPEVGTMFLLGSALLGLWGLRRKFKR